MLEKVRATAMCQMHVIMQRGKKSYKKTIVMLLQTTENKKTICRMSMMREMQVKRNRDRRFRSIAVYSTHYLERKSHCVH